jgi:hypothetical protein
MKFSKIFSLDFQLTYYHIILLIIKQDLMRKLINILLKYNEISYYHIKKITRFNEISH